VLFRSDVQEQVGASEQSVKSAIQDQVRDVEAAERLNSRKIDRLVQIHLDLQVQHAASHDQIVEILRRVNPSARRVPEPPSVTEGREKADAIKRSRWAGPKYDPTDPLADIGTEDVDRASSAKLP
jgi:septal ring factor EnvC (AmiA/AmiB activator)